MEKWLWRSCLFLFVFCIFYFCKCPYNEVLTVMREWHCFTILGKVLFWFFFESYPYSMIKKTLRFDLDSFKSRPAFIWHHSLYLKIKVVGTGSCEFCCNSNVVKCRCLVHSLFISLLSLSTNTIFLNFSSDSTNVFGQITVSWCRFQFIF